MKPLVRWILAAAVTLMSAVAWGSFHTFQIDEIFSNADGTIQYVVLHESMGMDGENFLVGRTLIASQGATSTTFTFPNSLPGGECDVYGCIMQSPTAHARVLIATQGFAALHLLTPDYVVPNGFLPVTNGTLNYAGVDQVTYASLPTDGVNALGRSGAMMANVATNFSGKSASVQAAKANYQGLWWAAPANSESGWGINFAHQDDTIFASWFTYDVTGKGMWLVMTAAKTASDTYAGKLFRTTGPPFNASPFDPAQVTATEAGSATLTFIDNGTSATFAYTLDGVTQTKTITRQAFGPLPNCASATGGLATAANYQDLWWAAPAASESGWGINFTHQGDTIFATWFTYDLDRAPMWLVVTALKTGPGVYAGKLFRTTGPPFNATPFNPANVVATEVGTATFTFSDGNHATFAYTVNGVSQSKAITREIFAAPGTVCN
jgi:hypothetical protein